MKGPGFIAVNVGEAIHVIKCIPMEVDTLKAAFSPDRSVNYYRGKLYNLYKGANEHVLDYIVRTKDLRQAILDNETRASDSHFSVRDRARLGCDILERFTSGLPPELRLPLQIEDSKDLTGAFQALLRIQHLAERDYHRYGSARAMPSLRNAYGSGNQDGYRESGILRGAPQPPFRFTPRADPERATVTCNYCKAPGHMKYDCELRRVNNERNQSRIQGNAPGGSSQTIAGPTALADRRSTETTLHVQPSPGSSRQ